MKEKNIIPLLIIGLFSTFLILSCFKPAEKVVGEVQSKEIKPETEGEEKNSISPDDLFEAISEGDESKAGFLLYAGISVNSLNNLGESPLMIAIKNDNSDFAKQLVQEFSANINATANPENSALTYTLLAKDMDLLAFLLKYGADPNKTMDNGSTAMNLAARTGLDFLKILEKNEGNIQGSGIYQPPIYDAIEAGDKDVVNYLIKKDPSINVLSSFIGQQELPRIFRSKKTDITFLYPSQWGKPEVANWEEDMGEKARLNISFNHPESDFRSISIYALNDFQASEAKELLEIYQTQSLSGAINPEKIPNLAGRGLKAISKMSYIEDFTGVFHGVMFYAYASGHYATPDLTCFGILTDGSDNIVIIRFSEKTDDLDFQNKLTSGTATDKEIANYVKALTGKSTETITVLYNTELQYVIKSFNHFTLNN